MAKDLRKEVNTAVEKAGGADAFIDKAKQKTDARQTHRVLRKIEKDMRK